MDDFIQLKEDFERYQPPSDLWDKIEADLEFESLLTSGLSTLPTHKAPEDLWDKIKAVLSPQKYFIVKKIRRWKLTAAAILFIFLGFGLSIWIGMGNENSTTLENSTKKVEKEIIEDQNEIEIVKNQYVKICKYYPEENPCSLVNDLSDLETAKLELENIVRQMGNSHNISRQLRRIELEKSKIIRNMAQRI
jgi:hypothetical protein